MWNLRFYFRILWYQSRETLVNQRNPGHVPQKDFSVKSCSDPDEAWTVSGPSGFWSPKVIASVHGCVPV